VFPQKLFVLTKIIFLPLPHSAIFTGENQRTMLYRQFYSELGKLLYAVADVDGMISQKEKKALQELVRKELVPVEKHTDKFGTDVAFYAEIEFDFLEDSMVEPEEAFESF